MKMSFNGILGDQNRVPTYIGKRTAESYNYFLIGVIVLS